MYTVMQNEQNEMRRKGMEHMLAFMVMLGVVASAFAGFVRVFNYTRVFYLFMLAEFIYTMFWYKKHLFIRLFTLMGTVFLIVLQYMVTYKSTRTHYYDYFYPYTCILDETKDVYIREVAHQEAVMAEEKDNNVRNIE